MVITAARDRRVLPALVALAVAAFLIVPMLLNASSVRAQSQEEENPCADVPESDFEDRDEAAQVHRESIDCVDFYGITTGADEEGRFYEPRERVRRDQMATFIVNTLEAAGLDERLPDGDPPNEFDDIADNPHRGSINILARIGVVEGTGGGDYSPREFVERDQMATFILQAYEWAYQEEYRTSNSYFGDVPPSNTHFGNINAAYEQELVRGVEEPDGNTPNSGEFDPNRDVLRQAMASFLANLLIELQGAPQEFCDNGTESPSPTSSASPTGTASPRPTGSASPTASASPTTTASPTSGGVIDAPIDLPLSAQSSHSPAPTNSASPSQSESPCAERDGGSPSPSPSSTASPRPTGSASPTATPTRTASPTPTATASENPNCTPDIDPLPTFCEPAP